MREEDHINSSSHLELGHVYDRLSKLETEVKEVQKGQHRMEVAINSKPRFPAWAAGIILTLGLQTATAIWWASGVNKDVSDLPALEMRLKRDDEARMSELHRYLDTRFGEVSKRLEVEEKRSAERDLLWQQLYARGAVKGITE